MFFVDAINVVLNIFIFHLELLEFSHVPHFICGLSLQLEYAALDAAVLLHIFRHVGRHSPAGTSDGNSKIEWKSQIVWISLFCLCARTYVCFSMCVKEIIGASPN